MYCINRWGWAIWLAVALVSPTSVEAGAWSQAPGGYYAKVSGLIYNSEEVFNDMGKRAPMGMNGEAFSAAQSFLYVEYGLRQRLTLVATANAGRLVSEDQFVERASKGVGDIELGLKYQWLDAPVVLAPQISLKIPTGYDADYDPALGTGKFDVELRLLLARSLHPWPLYVGAEIGYRQRGGIYSNQLPYVVEIGATPHARLFAKIFSSGINTRTKKDQENIGIVGLAQVSEGDFRKIGGQLAVNISGALWLDVLWERTVDGENIGLGTTWGLGLALTH